MDPEPLFVRVPASTSNLGPGFDLAGVALSLFLDVRVSAAEEAGLRLASLEGEAASWPLEQNLLLRAFELGLGRGADRPRERERGGYSFDVRSAIPLARGLGSSAAAIAAGLLLGAACAGRAPAREALLPPGIELEGHPDNIAPALLGGARLCVPLAGAPPRVIAQTIHPSIGWALAWPAQRIPTAAARAVLPRSVPLADAVENTRRLALLLEGLRSGEPELLRAGIADRFHVPYRLALIPGAEAVLAAARDAGAYAATVSGSGSAHVALGPKARAPEVAAAMEAAWRKLTGTGTGVAVEVVAEAPAVVRAPPAAKAP